MPTYFYTAIPGVIPHPFPGDAKTAGPAIITNPRLLMEHQLKDLKVVSDRALLVDGRIVFRTTEQWIDRLRKDVDGYFIEVMNVKYYFATTNPVTDQDAFFHEWGPL